MPIRRRQSRVQYRSHRLGEGFSHCKYACTRMHVRYVIHSMTNCHCVERNARTDSEKTTSVSQSFPTGILRVVVRLRLRIEITSFISGGIIISGNQILHACEPPSASSYPALVTRTGNRTSCDRIPHSAGIRARAEGNRIPHCIPHTA